MFVLCHYVADCVVQLSFFFFFSSRRRHTRCYRDWSSDVCSSDLVLGRLRGLGLVDDGTLCANLARTYRDVRMCGPLRIVGALLSRRFPRDLVEESVREVSRPGEELAAAAAALGKKFRDGIPADREGPARMFRFLDRRGFSPETCRQAIRRLSRDI